MMAERKLLSDALSDSRCVISVMGDHAGEGVAAIFRRKIADIQKVALTFWLVKSPKAKPTSVQYLCRSSNPCAFRCARKRRGRTPNRS